MKKEVLLDVDGVIADFAKLYVDRANSHWPGNDYRVEEITQWDCRLALGLTQAQEDVIMADSFAAHLNPYPGAVAAVKALEKVADVFFVTSHLKTAPTWVYDRDQWLEEHFGELGKRVIHTSHKYMTTGDVFVDDNPEHVESWQRRHPKAQALLWKQLYNRGHQFSSSRARFVSDWAAVCALALGGGG